MSVKVMLLGGLSIAMGACGGGETSCVGVETTTTSEEQPLPSDCTFTGTWQTEVGPNCGPVGPFDVTSATANAIKVSSFGDNASVTFTPKAGTTDVYQADGLTIFGVGAHHCEVTLDCDTTMTPPVAAIQVRCTNNNGGSCTEVVTPVP